MSGSDPSGGTRWRTGPALSNGVLLFCVLVLSGVVLFQNFWLRQTPNSDAPAIQPISSKTPVDETPRRSPSNSGASDNESPENESSSTIASPMAPVTPPQVTPRRGLAEDEAATIELFAVASPSVVHITTHALERDFFSFNVMEIPQGTGTGFVWDKQGHVVTNFHVIENADTAHVALADHSTWQAKLVGAAPEKDLAVLKIDAPADKLQPLPVGTSHDLQVGQNVFAIGNPFGLDQSLTTGVISALGREINSRTGRPIKDVIQTDAAINPGNSGGPLLDREGRLVGVTTAILSPSGAYAGIGFAIPVDVVSWAVPELIAHGKIIRPGLAITAAPDGWTQRIGVEGVLVLSVEANSSASAAGLRPTRRDRIGNVYLGEIITALGETPVHSTHDLLAAFEQQQVGDKVTLTLIRDRERVEVNVELEATD
jgi:S1-C subfamily serine protease